jgi:hypothetical protein
MLVAQNLIPLDQPQAKERAALRLAGLFDYSKSDMTNRNNGAASLLLSSGNVNLGVFRDNAKQLPKDALGVVIVGGRAMKISLEKDLEGCLTECESTYAERVQSEYGMMAGVMLLVRPDLIEVGQNSLQKQALMGAVNSMVVTYMPKLIREDNARYSGGYGSSAGVGQTHGHRINAGPAMYQYT